MGEVCMGRKSCKTSENKVKSPRFLPSLTFSKERAILVPGLMFDTPTLTNQLINSKSNGQKLLTTVWVYKYKDMLYRNIDVRNTFVNSLELKSLHFGHILIDCCSIHNDDV